MNEVTPTSEKLALGKWLVQALVVTSFAVNISSPIITLLTADFARSFFGNANPVSVGMVAQIGTVSGIAEVVTALVMGALAVRFKHKSLLLSGVALVAISAVGSFFSPTLPFLMAFFALEGAGTVMVGIMTFTMIGDTLPLDRKAKAISYIVAVTALAGIAGLPLIGFIANTGGWRYVFAFFVLPVAVIGLAMAHLNIPSKPTQKPLAAGKKAYISSFKQVLLNRSAVSCLVGGMLLSAMSVAAFSITYFRESFLKPMGFSQQATVGIATAIMIAAATMAIVTTLVSGRLINRFGRKPLTVVGSLGSSILVMLIFFMPNLWLAVAVDMAHILFAWTGILAFSCYALEQVPKARGTMMSLRSMTGNLGGAVGAAVGGAILVLLVSYQALGFAFGAIGVAGAAVFFFLTKDPTIETTAQPA